MKGGRVILEIDGRTDTGRVRDHNEDCLGLDESRGLLLVADGMGGHKAGEVASSIAVSSIMRGIAGDGTGTQGLSRRVRLDSLIRTADAAIREKASKDPDCSGMGTTLVALWAGEGAFTVAHVGDSRAYLYREGALTRLTRDHSQVQEDLDAGAITEAEAAEATFQNVLTRALGAGSRSEADFSEGKIEPGDILILATDGLCKMIDDARIARIAAAGGGPGRIAANLVEAANAAGGEDNVSVAAALARRRTILGFLREPGVPRLIPEPPASSAEIFPEKQL